MHRREASKPLLSLLQWHPGPSPFTNLPALHFLPLLCAAKDCLVCRLLPRMLLNMRSVGDRIPSTLTKLNQILITKPPLGRINYVDMPPLTAPDRPLHPLVWKVLLLLACVLVFCFALHAKMAVYGQSSQPQPTTSSKLWANAERFDAPVQIPSSTFLWLAIFLASMLYLRAEGRLERERVAVPRQQHSLTYLHRFLRPPPSW